MPRIGAGGARVIAAGLTAIQTTETKNGLGEFLKLGSIDFFSSSVGHLEQRRNNPVITLGKRPRECPEELRDGGRQAARAQAAQALDKLRVCLAESEKSSQKAAERAAMRLISPYIWVSSTQAKFAWRHTCEAKAIALNSATSKGMYLSTFSPLRRLGGELSANLNLPGTPGSW